MHEAATMRRPPVMESLLERIEYEARMRGSRAPPADDALPFRIPLVVPSRIERKTRVYAGFYIDLAGELGFEPRQTESESVVLPLHHSPPK